MKIPFHRPYISEDEIEAVIDSLRNGWLTMGAKTNAFEEEFKKYTGSRNAIAVNSCTAALHLSLRVINIEEGDEVIIPAMTFAASAEVVSYFKAKPVLVDVERDTHLIDINKISEKITQRTKAIMPVHYSGQPSDMFEIMEIAAINGLSVVEDSAHCLPAWYNGKKIGNLGDLTCFSFYATKTLTTGEGGMITTKNDEWAKRIRVLRLHGISRDIWTRSLESLSWEYDVEDVGYKYNTTDLNAAIGIEQLSKLELIWSYRERIAEKYTMAFRNIEGIILYNLKKDRISSWYLYPIKLNLDVLNIDRNRFIEEMSKRDIETSVHFIPLYRFSYYKKMGYKISDYPESEWIFQRIVSLPIFPGMKDEEVSYVIENVIDIVKKFKK